MDEIKRITYDELKEIAASEGFGTDVLLKDFYLTYILYLIKDIDGIYLKGGTALQKIFLNYSRLSEDIDLTVTKDIKEAIKKIEGVLTKNGFDRITKDKDV